MKIHEFQGKEILARYGIPVPRGKVARTVPEAEAAGRELGGNFWVVKAQIHAGGRGKGGGVKLARTPDELSAGARAILGMQLVTHQTGPKGQKVKSVLIEAASEISRELYLGMVLDRSRECPVIMASTAGGVDIEEVAAKTPEKIVKVHVSPITGLMPFHSRVLAKALELTGETAKQFSALLSGLYKVWCQEDCSLLEINPLVVTKDGRVVALDCKLNLDDNGLIRHKESQALRDLDEEDPTEVEASRYNLSYVKLDGNVGCMVNGAGLAMATMDIIKHYGGFPSNFLDVGGGASAETVEQALKIILRDPHVKSILINVFGGIVRCDRVANGVIQAARNVKVGVPLVVRLQGTNAKEARQLLQQSDMRFEVADGLAEAAEKAVAAAQGRGR